MSSFGSGTGADLPVAGGASQANRSAGDRVVITGMALNTPLGDDVDAVLDALLAGRSGITAWRAFPPPPLGALVGGDLSDYDAPGKVAGIGLPAPVARRLDKMNRRVPWSARLALLVAAEAAVQARWFDAPPALDDAAVVLAGHNLAPRYGYDNWTVAQQEPDYVDALLAVHMLDTNPAACVSELLGTRGALGTVGAACASGNLALRAALDELAEGASAVVIVAPIYDYAPTTLHALGLMGATTYDTDPARASRPFDADRNGFVPSHGCAAVVVETLASAQARGVTPLAEILAVEAGNDACHRPPRPSPEDQAALITRALARAGVTPEQIDLVSAHAASTPIGDLAEAHALTLALGEHAARVAVNAPKSMLGHPGWSAALVEAILAVAQLRRGVTHGTANLEQPDPRIGLSLPPSGPRDVRVVLNNAFGFGGLNCVSVLGRVG